MKHNHKVISGIAILVFLFLFGPLLSMTIGSFLSPEGWTLKWYLTALSSKSFLEAFSLSLQIGILATLISLIIGIPVSYVLWKSHIRFKSAWQTFFLSPTFIPGMVLGFALFQWLLLSLSISLYPALLIAHILVCLPYSIRVINSSLAHFDPSLEEVAWTLGMTKKSAFIKIVLPNISSGILAAFILAFLNSFNNYPISMFLTGPGMSTLPLTIMSYVEHFYDPTVNALSVLLMLMTAGLMFIVEKTLGLSTTRG